MPRSPCSPSTGWRKVAGVPVDVSVAAILRAMIPLLPMPETMTLPRASATRRQARTKSSPRRAATSWRDAASRPRTRRPSSTMASSEARRARPPESAIMAPPGARPPAARRPHPDATPPVDVPLHDAEQLAARLEERIAELPHDPFPPPAFSDPEGGVADQGDGVGHGGRQPHPGEDGGVGEVVGQHGHRVPFQPAGAAQFLYEGELVGPGVLMALDAEFGRTRRGRGRDPSRHHHHVDSRRLEEAHPETVVEVEALPLVPRTVGSHVRPPVGE